LKIVLSHESSGRLRRQVKGVVSESLKSLLLNLIGRISAVSSPIFLARYFDLYTPAYALLELYEKKEKIISKLKIPESDYYEIYFSLRFIVNFISEIHYLDKWQKALEIASKFDPKDTPFIALSLKLGIPIWTNDKKMIVHGLKSGKYLALDTQAVEDFINGKSLDEVKESLMVRFLNI